MNIKYLVILSVTFSSTAFSQELPPAQTVFFEQDSFIQPELLLKKTVDKDLKLSTLPPNSSLEDYINQAIIHKDWKELEKLLDKYRKTDNYDHILYEYGLGALYRFQGKQKKAIEMYKAIIIKNPNLYYPRFDLAMMLFENKQYTEAKNEFRAIRPFLPTQIQALIDQLLSTMEESQGWQPNVNFNFEKTNNVNQSSNIKEISIGDATFIRDEESLPQKAEGIGYTLNASRDQNMMSNHYVYFNATLNGIHYWDNTEFSEQTLRIDTGYKYKDLKQSFGIIPFIGQNILGDSRYSHNYGAGLEYNRLLSNHWQVSANTTHIQKRYQDSDLAQYYNGHANSQAALILYQPKSKLLIYSGLDWMQDRLTDEAESSNKKGIRSGFLYFGDSLGISGNIRYSKRNFLADNIWYGIQRKDSEYEFGIATWRKQWQWKGFTPKLNYRYQKIDSNLPLYERNNGTWFMTIDKKI